MGANSMNIKKLIELKAVLNIVVVAEWAGLNYNNLMRKINRASELTVIEAEMLQLALDKICKIIKK